MIHNKISLTKIHIITVCIYCVHHSATYKKFGGCSIA